MSVVRLYRCPFHGLMEETLDHWDPKARRHVRACLTPSCGHYVTGPIEHVQLDDAKVAVREAASGLTDTPRLAVDIFERRLRHASRRKAAA